MTVSRTYVEPLYQARFHLSYKNAPAGTGRFYVNAVLLGAAVLALAGHIYLANALVSRHYRSLQMKHEVNQAQIQLDAETALLQDAALDSLAQFARSRGMVEATEVGSLFMTTGVALGSEDARSH